MTTTIHISGLNTEPAPLIHPASDSRYRAYPRISLLTCWLSSSQVRLGPLRPSPTGQKYRISWAPAQSHRPGFILARAATCYVPLSQSESLFLMRVRRSVSIFPINNTCGGGQRYRSISHPDNPGPLPFSVGHP